MIQGTNPYSEALYMSIVEALQGGRFRSAVSCLFGVSPSSSERYARVADREGSLAPSKGSIAVVQYGSPTVKEAI